MAKERLLLKILKQKHKKDQANVIIKNKFALDTNIEIITTKIINT